MCTFGALPPRVFSHLLCQAGGNLRPPAGPGQALAGVGLARHDGCQLDHHVSPARLPPGPPEKIRAGAGHAFHLCSLRHRTAGLGLQRRGSLPQPGFLCREPGHRAHLGAEDHVGRARDRRRALSHEAPLARRLRISKSAKRIAAATAR